MASSRQYLAGVAIGIGVFAAAYFIFDFPRERQLKADKEALTAQLSILEQRADEALKVMEQIAERDNNFYRVMMQSEPITAAQRYAGLERQRNYDQLGNLSESELVKNVTG
ncbi:MAG: M23 family peptidase, partial [Muribaculaceae bacterium]